MKYRMILRSLFSGVVALSTAAPARAQGPASVPMDLTSRDLAVKRVIYSDIAGMAIVGVERTGDDGYQYFGFVECEAPHSPSHQKGVVVSELHECVDLSVSGQSKWFGASRGNEKKFDQILAKQYLQMDIGKMWVKQDPSWWAAGLAGIAVGFGVGYGEDALRLGRKVHGVPKAQVRAAWRWASVSTVFAIFFGYLQYHNLKIKKIKTPSIETAVERKDMIYPAVRAAVFSATLRM
jgi:hypothetical protein